MGEVTSIWSNYVVEIFSTQHDASTNWPPLKKKEVFIMERDYM